MEKFPIVSNEALLASALNRWPQYQLGAVCSCGKVFPAQSIPGHIGGSNKKWTIKAKFQEKHKVNGYTLVRR
jgi:hypothetical protein